MKIMFRILTGKLFQNIIVIFLLLNFVIRNSLWGTISRQSEWLQSKRLQVINAGEGVEKREPSYTVGGNAN